MDYSKNDAKSWTREHLKGIVGAYFPTYSGDPLEMDEEACRQDLRIITSMGMSGIYFALSYNCTSKEWHRFMQIGVEECKGKVLSVILVHPDTIDDMYEQTAYAEQIGADLVNIMTPPSFIPSSDQDIYDIYKSVADSVNIGVTLYPSPKAGYIMRPQLIARLAEVPNIVGSKQNRFDNTANLQTFRLTGDKIVIGIPTERDWPLFIEHGLQVALGTPSAIMFQTPDKLWLQHYWNALQERDWDNAMKWYWRLAPLRELFWELNAIYFTQVGFYPFLLWKYWMGMLGLSHSSLRQPLPVLTAAQKERIKQGLIRVGLLDEATATEREPQMILA